MATSGRVESGTYNYSRFYFQWQLAGQDIGGNYSVINWQWGLVTTSGAWWGSNAVKSVNGFINGAQVFGGATWSGISNNGDHQLHSGSINVGHNGDGTKNFGISSTGWLYGGGNFGNSGSWDLPTIPRQVNITGVSGTFTSDNVSANVSWAPNGNRVDLRLGIPSTDDFKRWPNVGGASGTFTLTPAERNALNATIPNANTTRLRWIITTVINGVDTYHSHIDTTYQMVNANPGFPDFAYKDNNAAVVAITGNDQVLVQGQSELLATISPENKMVAVKSATPNKYIFAIDTLNANQAYTTAAINKVVGIVINAGTKRLSVKAFDSRNNFTEVYKDITVVPYTAPVVGATVARENGFEDQTSLQIAGTYSLVEVGGTPKNIVSTSVGVRYRYKETGGSFGSWVNKTATVGGGNISTSETLLSLDNETEFDFQVEIIDLFGSTVIDLHLGVGRPILFIGANRTVGINHVPEGSTEGLYIAPGDALWDLIFPVGRRYQTNSASEDPNDMYRGSWTRSGASAPYTWLRNS